MIYDVAIIGGGLAGLALSIDLKKRGYNILVIEKGSYPRHKVCGEYISLESKAYLYKLCPALNLLALPNIKNFKLTSGNSEFTTSLDLGGFGISRYLLEELLYNQALKQGVVFRLNTKAYDTLPDNKNYKISTNGETAKALLVCNSSGRKSNLETKEKTQETTNTNYIGIKYHIKISRDRSLIEIHNFEGGYCGISNIEDDKTCLCYIVNSSYLKNANNSIATLEKEILSKNKHLEKIFTSAEFLFKEPLTISGINFRIKKTIDDTSFFLGDSAGSVSPITGNGMSIGLKSAWALAQEIDSYFSTTNSKKQLVENYNKFWSNEFSTRIKLSRYFQKLAEYPSLTKITISAFNTFPFIANKFIKKTHGKPF
ncbi:MAG: NAD(P)/FAD-dependent oxidoreductase [Bacteroidia bacterium]